VLEVDTLAVTDRLSGVETRIPLREVALVTEASPVSRALRGARDGFLTVTGCGLVGATALALICEGEGCAMAGVPFLLAPITGVIFGVPFGAAYGLLERKGITYTFQTAPDSVIGVR
jgi:hypothetical protein